MTNASVLAFCDTETTGLIADMHHVWEIAVILRKPDAGGDVEFVWQVRPDLSTADQEALRISRFTERFQVPDGAEAAYTGDPRPIPLTVTQVQNAVSSILTDAVIIGSNPAFDANHLTAFLRVAPWHYRTVDVATLAAGYLHGRGVPGALAMPLSSRRLSQAVGVAPPGPDVAHTALGDARWVRDTYDALACGTPDGASRTER